MLRDKMNRHLALVEDDDVILANYADFLVGLGYRVDAYSTKEAALQGLVRQRPELILLDITLNGERDAGYAVCAEVRHHAPQLPIIFLTSHDGEVDKISGLRLGADDYITKDVSLDYLVVRIEALFRRIEAYTASSRPSAPIEQTAVAAVDQIEFDLRSSIVRWQSQRVDLTLTQVWMLQELCKAPGQPRSHGELMRAAKIVVEANTITAHIKAIREAFQRVDPGFDRIRTERGRGYRWVPH